MQMMPKMSWLQRVRASATVGVSTLLTVVAISIPNIVVVIGRWHNLYKRAPFRCNPPALREGCHRRSKSLTLRYSEDAATGAQPPAIPQVFEFLNPNGRGRLKYKHDATKGRVVQGRSRCGGSGSR